MYYIITEDTGSGYKFLYYVCRLVVIEKITVLNPKQMSKIKPQNYKTKRALKSGGNMAAFTMFKNLLNDNFFAKGDTVFLAIDNIVDTDGSLSRITELIQSELDECKALSDAVGIKLCRSNTVCFEESFLSFEKLCEFCGIPKKCSDSVVVYYIRNRNKFFRSTRSNSSRNEFLISFYKHIKSGKNIEQCLSLVLDRVTSFSRNFYVNKSKLGNCWLLGCNEARKYMSSMLLKKCSGCYAHTRIPVKDKVSVVNRLSYVVHHSRFKEIFDTMGVQLTAY